MLRLQLGTLNRLGELPGNNPVNRNSNRFPHCKMVSMFHSPGKRLFFPRGVVASQKQLEKMWFQSLWLGLEMLLKMLLFQQLWGAERWQEVGMGREEL